MCICKLDSKIKKSTYYPIEENEQWVEGEVKNGLVTMHEVNVLYIIFFSVLSKHFFLKKFTFKLIYHFWYVVFISIIGLPHHFF